MAAHPERSDINLVGKILTGKEKTNVSLFIPDRKAISERVLVASPPAPETDLLVDIDTLRIKRLVYEAFSHGLHQSIILR